MPFLPCLKAGISWQESDDDNIGLYNPIDAEDRIESLCKTDVKYDNVSATCAELIERFHGKEFLKELQGVHCGDCICFPVSCSKCWAEMVIDVDTTKGLDKHGGSSIYSAFKVDGVVTCEDAISYLTNKKTTATMKWMEQWLEKWETERIKTLEWLKKYRTERLGR